MNALAKLRERARPARSRAPAAAAGLAQPEQAGASVAATPANALAKTELIATPDGDVYAFGALWFATARTRPLDREARHLLRTMPATHAVLAGSLHQIGVINAAGYDAKVADKARSAALAVCAKLTHRTFLAAFETSQGWYVVVRNSQLLPNGDVLFTDEAAAQAHYKSFLGLSHWAAAPKYAPRSWNLPDTIEESLAGILDAPATPKVQRADRIRQRPYVLGAAAAVAVAAVAAGFYAYTHRTKPLVAQARYEPLPDTVPDFVADTIGCLTAAQELHRRTWVPGWPLTAWSCGPQTIGGTYTREEKAPIPWYRNLPDATLSADMLTATVTQPRPALGGEPLALTTLRPAAEVQRLLGMISVDVGGTVTITVAPPTIIGQPQSPMPPPDWKRVTWTLITAAPPSVWLTPLATVPGTAPETITTDTSKTTITATTYVLP